MKRVSSRDLGTEVPRRGNFVMRSLGGAVLRLMGWRVVGDFPNLPRLVAIGAPHTSNWDFVIAMSAIFALSLRISWMGKHTLFKPPYGGAMRWLGGLAINRTKAHGVVDQLVDVVQGSDRLWLAITPEGTRKRVPRWKTGFYHVAVGAGLPIVLGFLDFARREGGYRGTFMPTGDLDRDLARIKAQYKGIKGKYPEQSVY